MVKNLEDISIKSVVDELLVFAFFFVPFVNFSPVACGVVLLCSLFSLLWNLSKGVEWSKSNVVLFSVIVFMAYSSVASLLLQAETHPIVRLQFQIRLPLLLFALAFFVRGRIGLPLRRAMKFFACGSYGMAMIVLLVFAYSLVMDFDNVPRSFMNISLCFQCVVNMIVHRTYMCFDLMTALLLFYFLLSVSWNRRRLCFFLSLYVFSGLFIFLTDARISFLSFLFLSFCLFFMEVKRYISGWRSWVIMVIVLIVLLCLLLRSERVNNILISLNDASFSLVESDPRFMIWSCGWDLFMQCPHPLWGYGCGTAGELLQEVYVKKEFISAIDSHWEMHNQFLEVLVENGVVGLLLFLGMLSLPMFMESSLRRFYCIWIPMLCINLFFESMLSRAIGTYPIAAILLLGGISDGKGDFSLKKGWKWFYLVSSLVAISCLSVKYIQKDKKILYAPFQRFYERVDVLPGNPPEDLAGAYGLKIDNRTQSEVWRDYATMYYCLDRQTVDEADSVSFSIYMYASEDFNAETLQIRVEERQRKAYEASYDMGRRGEWQKLSIGEQGLYGNLVFTVSCAKKGVIDFSSIGGFAIFAQPKINIIRKK